MVVLLLVLQEIFSNATEQSTSNRSQEAMASLFAQEVATEGTASSTKETTITLGHWRSVWVIVRSVGFGGLTRGLRQRLRLTLLALTHLVLVGLVLRIRVAAAVLLTLLLTLLLTVVSWLALRVASVVGAELVGVLTVLETALLRRTEGILTTWWGEALILWRVLFVALLRRVSLLLAVTLLRPILLVVAALATVGIVRTRHDEW